MISRLYMTLDGVYDCVSLSCCRVREMHTDVTQLQTPCCRVAVRCICLGPLNTISNSDTRLSWSSQEWQLSLDSSTQDASIYLRFRFSSLLCGVRQRSWALLQASGELVLGLLHLCETTAQRCSSTGLKFNLSGRTIDKQVTPPSGFKLQCWYGYEQKNSSALTPLRLNTYWLFPTWK